MPYTKTPWVNDAAPYIDSTNLNNIEDGIESVTAAHEVLAATSNNIDVLAVKYISRGHIPGEGFEIELGGEVEHGHFEYFKLTDGASSASYDRKYLMELPTVRYTPDISFYPGQSLDFTFEPNYTPGSSYFSGRKFIPKALPSSGDWNGHIENSSILGFTNGGSAQVHDEGGFNDNTTAADLYGNLGEFGRNDGRFPVADFHRGDDDQSVNNFKSGVSGYYEYADDSILSTLAADDVVFCFSNDTQSSGNIYLDSFQVGSVDLANNRLNLREGAGHRPDNHSFGHILLNKGFKQNSVTDLGGATIYNSEGGTGGDWKLNVEDSTTAWPEEYVGSAIILDDGTGNKKYVVLANNQGSSTAREGNVDSGFVDQTAYTEFDVWFWYDTSTGDSTDNIPYTPAIGVNEWGLSEFDSRIASTAFRPGLQYMPGDGTAELVDEGYYKREYNFTNNQGSFPIGTAIALGQTGDFTFIDWTVAIDRQGRSMTLGGYGSFATNPDPDTYTFDGTIWYEAIMSSEVGGAFSGYKPHQMRPTCKLEAGVWYYNDDTGCVFDHNPNGDFNDRTNFDAACLDVNWVVSTNASGKSLPSDISFAWVDYVAVASAEGSYRVDIVSGITLLSKIAYNDTTNTENLMYTFMNSRLTSPPNILYSYAAGWTRIDPDYEYGTFRGTKFVMSQYDDPFGPIKVIIYGKLIT